MAESRLSNQEFLNGWLQGQYPGGLLELEKRLVDERLEELGVSFQDLVKQKTTVAEQSGDNWHDGAFRATDEASMQLSKQAALLREVREWPVVTLPEAGSPTASLGSRALLRFGGEEVYFDFVGISMIHQDFYDNHPTGVEMATIGSPIAKAVIGKSIGQQFSAQMGSRRQQLALLDTTPSPDLNER